MLTLLEAQMATHRAITRGPTAIDERVFAGNPNRVFLALKAHANTVSHARLIALEETFPLTRDALGVAIFNAVSRTFIESGGGCAAPLAAIGDAFPNALKRAGVDANLIHLARFEWAWLTAFHAADTMPLMLADVQNKSEADVLLMRIARHPAAHIVANCLAIPGGHAGDNLLITRPDEAVQTCGIGPVETTLCAVAGIAAPLGDVLATTIAEHAQGDVMAALLTLISAGALYRVGDT